jgi:CBS domain-containing protein
VLVREAMTVPVVTVAEDDDVPHTARVLLHHRISSVPVVDRGGTLVGVVSESDLLRDRVGRDPRAHFLPRDEDGEAPPRTVAAVMTARPVTVDVRADLADATRLLLARRIKALPVVDGHRLVGVLARRDVLATLAHPDEDVRAAVLARLREQDPSQSWEVTVTDGVVTLDGPLHGAAQRLAAVVARTVAGVVRVHTGDGEVAAR